MKKGPYTKVRAYLAGPMTGYEKHNFPAFEKNAEHLRNFGYDIVSPAELEALETGPRREWAYYLKRDIRELLTCEAIFAMRGWENSPGATLEVYIGWRLGFRLFRAEDLRELVVANFDFSGIQNETNSGAFMRSFTMRKMDRNSGSVIGPGLTSDTMRQSMEFPTEIPEGTIKAARSWKLGTSPINPSSEFLLNHGPLLKGPEDCYTEKPKPENILKEADRIVGGDRAAAYGHPREDFARTAQIWSAVLGFNVPVEKVALCMIGVKMSRQCNAAKRDNWVDMAGYAQTGYMVDQKDGRME